MSGRKIFGVILVVVGALLMVDKIGLYDVNMSYIFSNYWPLVIVIVGGFSIISNPASKLGGTITLIIGVLLQLRILGYFNVFEYIYLWPTILILVGIWIMFSKGDGWNKDSSDSINGISIFSGTNIRNFSQSFKGGSAVAIFGGVDIDLREAKIGNTNQANLDVFSAFGGVDIIVPKDWNVVIKGVPIFGGWSNKTMTSSDDERPILKVNCFVVFGGMEIMN